MQNQDPGEYRLIVYARSTVTGTFNQALTLTVFVDTPTMPLMVDVAGGGTGTVTSSPSGLNCTPATTPCTLNVTPNQAVTLTATPDTQQSFAGWQGGCAGTSGTCQVTVDQAKWAVARFAPAPTIAVTYYHLDALGSVRALSDQSGAIVQRHDYGAFGEDTAPLGGDPRRFTGKELDPESAWMYFGARYYRNVVGRFTSVDPFSREERALTRPQLWSRYQYASNNPLKYIDPDGRAVWLGLTKLLEQSGAIRDAVDHALGANDPNQSKLAKITQGVADKVLDVLLPTEPQDVELMVVPMVAPMGVLENAAAGRAAEAAAGWIKNTRAVQSITGTAARRFPDMVDRLAGLIGEVKGNLLSPIRLTDQIRDFIALAKREGWTFILRVSRPELVTPELRQAIIEEGGRIERIGG